MKKSSKLINNIFGIICIIGLVYILYERNKIENRINSNHKFSIGKITRFRPSRLGNPVGITNTTGDSGLVEYFFVNNGDTIINSYGNNFGKIPKSNECLGKKYLVVFNSNNPKESRILVDKPINDSIDFHNYIKEFEGRKVID